MATIGNTDTSESGARLNLPWETQLNDVDTITLAAGQQLEELHFYGGTNVAGGTAVDLNIGIFDVTSGTASAPLLASGVVVVNATTDGLYSLTGLTIDLSAHSGKTVAVGHAKALDVKAFRNVAGLSPQSLADGVTLADPFVENVSTGDSWQGLWAVVEAIPAGPTLTAPDATTVDATRTVIGTLLDTATTAGLKVVSPVFSKTLAIDAQPVDGLSLDQTDDIDDGIALGTPVNSLPVEVDPGDMAAGATAYQIQQWVNDGTNPEVARNITLNYLAAHSTVQAMTTGADAANTDPTQSFFGTTYVVVEDDMQFSYPDVVDGVTLTVNAKGEPTTSVDQTISFNGRFWSPSTGQASLAGFTVLGSAIISSGGITRALIRDLVRPITKQVIHSQ